MTWLVFYVKSRKSTKRNESYIPAEGGKHTRTNIQHATILVLLRFKVLDVSFLYDVTL